MKKITSIAAALCMATAFCGFCSGCASEIEAKGMEGRNAATPQVSADGDTPKVILVPGYQFGYGTTPNTVETGATKLEATDEEKYWVSNAYYATVSAGAELPAATTTREKTTFVGWTYAKDGVVETVKTMPAALTEDLILYAQWNVTGSGGSGGGDVTTAAAAVNGKKMEKNPKPDNGVEEEYMITEETFETGATLTFTVNGSPVTISSLDGASTGLSFSSGTVTVAKGGTFDLYLKKMSSGWQIYGSRAIQPGEATILGEAAVDGNVYLAGNITGADFTWSNWNGGSYSSGEHKGLKATKNGSSYTLTVKLSKDDNCKFVMYTNPMKWQSSLTGSGASHISTANTDKNMVIQDTGTYTFTVTVSGSNLAVSVTYAA